jgi:hypothetical protein
VEVRIVDYYSMSGPNDPGLAVVVTAQDLTYDFLDSLIDPAGWEPVSLTTGPGKLVDYPPNNMVGWGTLCSGRMREALEEFSGLFAWLKVFVSFSGEVVPYYVLHAIEYPDVLDEEKSIYNKATGSVIKPVFSRTKIGNRDLFMESKGAVDPVCSEKVKHKLEREGITGIEFVKLPLS